MKHIELIDNTGKDSTELNSSLSHYLPDRKYTGFAYSAEEPPDSAQKESQL
jgi:hypothetical protein